MAACNSTRPPVPHQSRFSGGRSRLYPDPLLVFRTGSRCSVWSMFTGFFEGVGVISAVSSLYHRTGPTYNLSRHFGVRPLRPHPSRLVRCGLLFIVSYIVGFLIVLWSCRRSPPCQITRFTASPIPPPVFRCSAIGVRRTHRPVLSAFGVRWSLADQSVSSSVCRRRGPLEAQGGAVVLVSGDPRLSAATQRRTPRCKSPGSIVGWHSIRTCRHCRDTSLTFGPRYAGLAVVTPAPRALQIGTCPTMADLTLQPDPSSPPSHYNRPNTVGQQRASHTGRSKPNAGF